MIISALGQAFIGLTVGTFAAPPPGELDVTPDAAHEAETPGSAEAGSASTPTTDATTLPEDPLDMLDAATACFRRAQYTCAAETAQRLLTRDPLDAGVGRDALIIAAQAEALLDRPDSAQDAFRRLAASGSSWRPDRDADRRVIAAWLAARKPVTVPDTAPTEPSDPAPRETAFLPTAFFASVGAGVAIPVGDSADRYAAGLAAIIDAGWRWHVPKDPDALLMGLVLSFNLSSLALDDQILAESGQATTLRATALTAGLDLRVPIAPAWQVVLQAGVGYGSFGIGGASSGPALALQGVAGIRWQLAESFALRAEFTPLILIPFDAAHGSDGHPGVTLRAEASF